jgi:hypothetical protein
MMPQSRFLKLRILGLITTSSRGVFMPSGGILKEVEEGSSLVTCEWNPPSYR